MDPGVAARTHITRARRTTAIVAILVGGAVAFGLGLYARLHAPTGHAPLRLGFALPGEMKIWLTRVAAVFACFQLASGLRIDGRVNVPRHLPRWFRYFHRATGTLAVALATPVAFDCVAAFGFHATSLRVVVHSIVGLLLFGAFAAKVVAVQRRRRPVWLVPAVGTALFLALALLWLTSLGWPVSVY
jgi:Family of unknown function (DUF6529)